MSRFLIKSKCWEGIPDIEKIQLKKWAKRAHINHLTLAKEIPKNKKSAKRISVSLSLFYSNIITIENEFLNHIKHLETLLHFGSAGKLTENYKTCGYQFKKKLTLVLSVFYNVPFVSSKQLKLKSDRKTIKYYRDLYALAQFTDIEVQNRLNPRYCCNIKLKIAALKSEILLKFKISKEKIDSLNDYFKITSP